MAKLITLLLEDEDRSHTAIAASSLLAVLHSDCGNEGSG